MLKKLNSLKKPAKKLAKKALAKFKKYHTYITLAVVLLTYIRIEMLFSLLDRALTGLQMILIMLNLTTAGMLSEISYELGRLLEIFAPNGGA